MKSIPTNLPWISLRLKVALGIALPIIVMLLVVSFAEYRYTQALLERQTELSSEQLGEVILNSLNHALEEDEHHHNDDMLFQMLMEVQQAQAIQQAVIINLDSQVKVSGGGEIAPGMFFSQTEAGCIECHQYEPAQRPNSARLTKPDGVLRILIPIHNEEGCTECHPAEQEHVGVLLLDVLAAEVEQESIENLWGHLWFSGSTSILIALWAYFMIQWFVVQRIERIRSTLNQLATGDLASRIEEATLQLDEINDLIIGFNQMAERIERHIHKQEEHSQLRHQATLQERERLARELHDGLGQLLGYVNVKVATVRLLLKNNNIEEASSQLRDLEKAAHQLFIDMRVAIIGLRLSGKSGILDEVLTTYSDRFSQLSGLTVEVDIDPQVTALLPSEKGAHLLRIIQEALNNVRKHASATQVRISIQMLNGNLQLRIVDNGKGFEPDQIDPERWVQIGMDSMRERAQAIDGKIQWDSETGKGTQITVTIPLKGKEKFNL